MYRSFFGSFYFGLGRHRKSLILARSRAKYLLHYAQSPRLDLPKQTADEGKTIAAEFFIAHQLIIMSSVLAIGAGAAVAAFLVRPSALPTVRFKIGAEN
jgi:hypothetical protein